MLKVGDKINYIKQGKAIAIDEVIRVINPIAFTKFGKRFLIKAKILFPLIGHRQGFSYERINNE